MDLTNVSPIEVLAGGSLTIWAIIGLWDRFFSRRAKDLNEADGRLLNLNKEAIAVLTNEKKTLEDLMHKKDQIEAGLIGENKTLREVLQGRDQDSVEYRKQALQAMNETKQTFTLVKGLYEMVQASSKISENNSNAIVSMMQFLTGDKMKRAPQFDTTDKKELPEDDKMA